MNSRLYLEQLKSSLSLENVENVAVTDYVSSAGSTDVTYAELVTLINNSELKVGYQYKITDYRTVHYIVYDWGTRTDDIITGELEPLSVFAIASNKISTIAFSENYPQDIIHYDWNPDNWLKDTSFADTENDPDQVIVSGFKGVITYREDTKYNNKCGYDFRNVRFRRWAISGQTWTGTTAYDAYDFVEYNNQLYVALTGNTNVQPTNTAIWVSVYNTLSTTRYISVDGYYQYSSSGLLYDTNDYVDVLTFGDYYDEGVAYNNTISSIGDDSDTFNYNGTILPNISFVPSTGGGIQVFDTHLGSNTFDLTIVGNSQFNIISGPYCYQNVLINPKYNEIINCEFYENFIGANFTQNTIHADFYKNRIGINFKNNEITQKIANSVFNTGTNTNVFNRSVISAYFPISMDGNTFEPDVTQITGNYSNNTILNGNGTKIVVSNNNFADKIITVSGSTLTVTDL